MANFCIYCGTRLEKNASFCTKCGGKVEIYEKPKGFFDALIREIDPERYDEREKDIKEVQRIIGVGTEFNDTFLNELKRNGLAISDGKNIKEVLLREIGSGKIKSGDVRNRIDELLLIRNEQEKFNKNRLKYLEELIKDSCPNIKLATFEKEYINNADLYFDQLPNSIAKEIINTHKKIGDYDFAGLLIEEGGFTNRVDIIGLNKRVRKESDYRSNVFLKIFDNKIKIVGSEIRPFSFNPRLGNDMTIFFMDLISVDYYSTSRYYSNGEINFSLSNKRKLKLTAYKEDKKYLEEFYKSLNNEWEKFKNNKNDSSANKHEISSADELMKYAELYEKGLLTKEEFDLKKAEIMGTSNTVSENDVTLKFCTNCGNPLDSDSKFCPNCGTPLEK